MKQRFSSLDVKVIAHELSHVVCSLRLSNVYDLSSRTFLIKFAKPGKRRSLLVESGFRCHLTEYTRATAAVPSAFVARLRKYLRSRRVTSVAQVGTDRILELQFSDGQYRLFLEFYAGGNIILTDKDLNILSLLRLVSEGKDQEELRIGSRYSVESRQNHNGIPLLTDQRVRSGLDQALRNGMEISEDADPRPKRVRDSSVRKALAGFLKEFPPMLLDHAMRLNGFEVDTSIEKALTDEEAFRKLMVSLKAAKSIADNLASSPSVTGFIVARSQKVVSLKASDTNDASTPARDETLLYEEFQPFRPQKHENDTSITILEHEGYNKTVDEFFSSLETQKLESRLTEKQVHAMRKLESAKLDHEKRLGSLQQVQVSNVRKAQAIENNLDKVQKAMSTVNSLIAQGVGWPEISQIIESEQKQHNEVAMIIKLPLKLYENTITLWLADSEGFSDFEGSETNSEISESESDSTPAFNNGSAAGLADDRVAVDVNLALSPWSNARQYYEQKKTAVAKEQRTLLSSKKALESTERKITADLKRGLKNEKDVMRPERKALWFEKFLYFISSEGYLVIGGRDSQQSDILYAKHLRKGDVYVHADLDGAASIIVQNKPGMPHDPIPPSTLSQAGTLSICTSSAWESKAIMSAWWVHADQVTKLASSGDYLQPGDFSVLGPKNYLPPTQLQVGFGVIFHISEKSKAHHVRNRVHDKVAGNDSANVSVSDLDAIEANGSRPPSSIDDQADHIDNDDPPIERESDLDHHQADDVYCDQDEDVEASVGEVDVQHHSPKDDQTYSVRQKTADECKDDGSPHDTHAAAGFASQESSGELELQNSKGLKDSEPRNAKALQIRGKSKKYNKLKTKYLDQDDEDRTFALRLLGSAAKQENVMTDSDTKVIKEQEVLAARERRKEQHAKIAAKNKAAEELHQRLLEHDGEQSDEKESEQINDLDLFVGAILPEDEVVDAFIMCGPWDAIGSRCRWKAKLQPGSTKKGKAVREILASWNAIIDLSEKNARRIANASDEATVAEDQSKRQEGQLIRNFREAEIVGIVPVGKVRIIMGNNEVDKSRGQKSSRTKRGGKGNKKR